MSGQIGYALAECSEDPWIDPAVTFLICSAHLRVQVAL